MIIVYPHSLVYRMICTSWCYEGVDTVALCVTIFGGCNLIELMANLEGRRFPVRSYLFLAFNLFNMFGKVDF